MIIRAVHNKNNPYFMVRRDTAQDSQLPARALGLLIYLMSKPDNWEPTIEDICRRFPDIGQKQAYRLINDTLIPKGYARRVCERENGRVVRWITEIYETPVGQNCQVEPEPDGSFGHVDDSQMAVTTWPLPDGQNQMAKMATIDINRVQNTEDKLQKEQITDVARTKPRQRPAECDEQYLLELQANPAYSMLNVQQCYYRMVAWCNANRKEPTRRRFINWLNREDKPMTATPKNPSAYVGKSPPAPRAFAATEPDADKFMAEAVDELIEHEDLIGLGEMYDAIIKRGGAKAEWEIAAVAYYELHKDEPATPEMKASLNTSINALVHR